MYKLYIGNETYLSFTEAKKFVKTLRDESQFEYISMDAEKIKAGDLIDILSSNSLFNTQRVIFLKRVYRNKERESIITFLLEYLDSNSTDYIVLWEDQKVSSVTKYVKFFKQKNLLEEYTKLNKRTFASWAKGILNSENININNNALDLLIQYSNYDTERFENSIKKLKLLDNDSISEEDIRELYPNTLEEDIWKLLDEINSENGQPLLILENLFKQEVDPNYIISMIVRNIRLRTMAKYMIEKGSSYSEIASVLKIPPFTVGPIVSSANRYTSEKIKTVYEKLSSLDYEIKVGRIEPKLGLTLLCTIL
ncbi:DNA polymerase III subunit delta [Candidatus Dojkabacteria bacterium HGW-Dojkabacteria-1]|uniref:DNA polymerase III subunit delta n=1 Tax=Candidatus Dojkabacteria bacterium HGW-Dojkabacteria-1 TaxID=2013761 RepID=A0A2N2F301_9BACT|nr:MAG: DNA polymerase III subunit delta [Candidatus Dojkabacteria bacterium HGW-Dojkabacteria-1]